MLFIKQLMAVFLLVLTFAHVIDSDGPCDYEENQGKHSTCLEESCHIPSQNSTNIPSNYFIPDHIGHSPVIISSKVKLQVTHYLLRQIFYPSAFNKILFFHSEIFRPPLG